MDPDGGFENDGEPTYKRRTEIGIEKRNPKLKIGHLEDVVRI
jgi:hypothetical protein